MVESMPREISEKRSGISFYFRNGTSFEVVKFQSEMECATVNTRFDDKNTRNICVIQRPQCKNLFFTTK